MTLDDLIVLARIRLRDKITPYFWEDDELIEFANSAVDEACIRARLLQDTITIPVTAGVDVASPAYNVLSYKHGFFNDGVETTPITKISDTDYNWLVKNSPVTQQKPLHFKCTANSSDLILFPAPASSGTITIDVRRMPLASERLVGGSDVPPIPEQFQRDLVWWMVYEAYSVHDADLQDKAAADKAEAKFEAKFGRRPTARGEAISKISGVGESMYPAAYGGFNTSDFHHAGEFFL